MKSGSKREAAAEAIASALVRITSEGGDSNFAIIVFDDPNNIYVQFSGGRGEGGVYAEVVGNDFIAPDRTLSDEQLGIIKNFGWTVKKEENYSREFSLEADNAPREIASEIIDLFETAYRVTFNNDIDVTVELE